MVEEGPLCIFQTQVSPEYLREHKKPSLHEENENDEQHCNQSQHIQLREITYFHYSVGTVNY